MRLLWEDRAWDDYLYWQTQDRKTLKRINAINADTILAIQEVQELKKDPNKKIYGSFSEVLEELDNDE